MSGFIGLNELFVKLEFKFGVTLMDSEKAHIKKLLYPLSKRNKLTFKREDFTQALIYELAIPKQ